MEKTAQAPSGARRSSVDLTEGDIVKKIILFALPILGGSVFTQLYNTVDTVVVGRFVGSGALAAVGASAAINMVCHSVLAGIGQGTGVIVSQYVGSKKMDQVGSSIRTAVCSAGILGIFMALIGLIISRPVLELLHTPEEILDQATLYLRIVFGGLLGNMYYQIGSIILRSLGDSRYPMYMIILSSIINIILDVVFVVCFHWDVAGVAIATVIAQCISAILILIRIFKGFGFKFRDAKMIDGEKVKIMVRLGVPIALQMFVTSIGTLIIQRYGNDFGTDYVAANTVITRVDTFALMPLMSFGNALTTFVGQNIGAKKVDRVKEGVRKGTWMIIAFSAFMGLLMIFFGKYIVMLFNKETAVVEMGAIGLSIMAFSYWSSGITQSYNGMLRGAGDVAMPLIITFGGMAIRIPLTILLAVRTGDFRGMFYAIVIANIIGAIVLLVYYKKGNWQEKGLERKAAKAAERKAMFAQLNREEAPAEAATKAQSTNSKSVE